MGAIYDSYIKSKAKQSLLFINNAPAPDFDAYKPGNVTVPVATPKVAAASKGKIYDSFLESKKNSQGVFAPTVSAPVAEPQKTGFLQKAKGIVDAYKQQVERKSMTVFAGALGSIGGLVRSVELFGNMLLQKLPQPFDGNVRGEKKITQGTISDTNIGKRFQDWTQQGAEAVKQSAGITPENQTFVEKATEGLGSSLPYFVPGVGLTRAATALRASPKLAMLFGNVSSSALESMAEAGQVFDEVSKTKGEAEGKIAAMRTFLANAVVLTVTERLGIFNPNVNGMLKRALVSMPAEGVQESLQQMIQNNETGRPMWEGVLESGAIGAVVGGVLGPSVDIVRLSKEISMREEAQSTKPETPQQAAKFGVTNPTAGMLVGAGLGLLDVSGTGAVSGRLKNALPFIAQSRNADDIARTLKAVYPNMADDVVRTMSDNLVHIKTIPKVRSYMDDFLSQGVKTPAVISTAPVEPEIAKMVPSPIPKELEGLAANIKESKYSADFWLDDHAYLYTDEAPKGSKIAPVGFGEKDLVDWQQYAKGAKSVRETVVPISKLTPKIAGGKKGLTAAEQIADQAWHGTSGASKIFPPPTIELLKDGNLKILDGNHRVAFFEEAGYDYVPVRLVDKHGIINKLDEFLDANPSSDLTDFFNKVKGGTPSNPGGISERGSVTETRTLERGTSRVFERLKAEQPEVLKGELTYQKINLQEQAERAVDLIQKDKQQAFRVAMGVEESTDVTSTAVNVALSERALEEGNLNLYTRLVKNRSLAQTRRGQEIVSERGSISDNSTSRFVKQLIAVRLANAGKMYLSNLRTKMTDRQKGMEVLDKEVKKAKEKLGRKEMDLAAAQKLIDSLAC